MRLLDDERLYWDAGHCLRFLRELPAAGHRPPPELFHVYWQGTFSAKHAFSVRSILATQPERGEIILWLDPEDGYPEHRQNPHLRELASEISIRPFIPSRECRGTPLEGRTDLQQDPSPLERANLVRLVTLYKHGGIYLDLDTMLLRDLGELLTQPFMTEDFCYRWSAHLPYGNNAVLRFGRESENAWALMERSVQLGTCNPHQILRFEGAEDIDLTILPCAFFDPLWPHFDGRDRLESAPFDDWSGFFRKFSWRFRPGPDARSYSDFFPGAFAYHWHNQWDAPEHERSYFGRFSREMEAELERASGPAPRSRAAAAG
jgi:hypothetical protein